MNSKIAGVTFEGRQTAVALLADGEVLRAVREPENKYDKHAIALVRSSGAQVGYINAKLAENFSAAMDGGVQLRVVVTEVTGGEHGHSLGANISIEMLGGDEA